MEEVYLVIYKYFFLKEKSEGYKEVEGWWLVVLVELECGREFVVGFFGGGDFGWLVAVRFSVFSS